MKELLARRVSNSIREVVGVGAKPLHEPCFAGNEWKYLKECLDSTFVSSVGRFVDRFEADLADYTGAKHAVAIVNGTAALHIALHLGGVVPDDEVLVPDLSFVAMANAVAYTGAIPHFVDVEEGTLGLDPAALRDYLRDVTEARGGLCINRETQRIIRAVVPMHTFGHPMKIDGLLNVAREFNLTVVEDSAESLGSTFGGRHMGTFGLVGSLSFNGNKTITTGGGGAILTNDSNLARLGKHLTTTAKIPHRWKYEHDAVGYNYRLPNLNAALGCAQLEQLPTFVERKRALFERYRAAFADIEELTVVAEPKGARSNYWLQTVLLSPSIEDQRDVILEATNDSGLMTRPAWSLLSGLAPFRSCPKMDTVVARALVRRIINLPSSSQLAV